MLDRKREMINALTDSAWSLLAKMQALEQQGLFTLEAAQAEAKTLVQGLRYGEEAKDYFWISDMRPVMIMHPYRSELNNTDLSNYQDPDGKRLFVEFARVVRQKGEGYVDYMWQWKDDSTHIVPKLSFVRGFEPWGWIIGTGIYVEDVKAEIAQLSQRLIYISLAILLILGVILIYVNQQSLRIEARRRQAEEGLRESEAKYRALVEASTEGLVMMLGGEYVYANAALLTMLGLPVHDSAPINLEQVLCDQAATDGEPNYFKRLKQAEALENQLETQLRRVDGRPLDVLLFISDIQFGDKTGYTIIVKDVSVHKKIEGELNQSRETYQTLINNISIGLFRAALGRHSRMLEANSSAAEILGFTDREALFKTDFFDLIDDRADREALERGLQENGGVKNDILQIRTHDGAMATVSVSAVLVRDETGAPLHFDGILEDITQKIRLDEERESLIVELQTSLRFLNEPVDHYMNQIVSCPMHWPVHKVARLMVQKQYSAALITHESGAFVGLVTDRDLRSRVVSEKMDLSQPVHAVMSAPVMALPADAPVFHALLFMNEQGVRHLALKNGDGEIIGMVSSEELLKVHRHSSSFLLREIKMAETVDELIHSHSKLPRLVKAFVDSGAKAKHVTQIITAIFDGITHKLIEFAIEELGPPPVPFAFMALGSGGRNELTLTSDQDNAILYEDVPAEDEAAVHAYFHRLGQRLCAWLNAAGYVYCEGEAMASNPKWCQPLSNWKDYFHTWITQSEPQDLIDISIFFDFRHVYGEEALVAQLKTYLFQVSEGQAAFLQHLVKNGLLHKPPVGLLGKIVVESKGAHPETLDIKLAALPLVDYARIYALKNQLAAMNTLERLHAMWENGVINKTTFEEMAQAYNFLMQLRFKHQALQIAQQLPVDNFIDPHALTHIEQTALKNTFSQISSMQKKLNYDFTGQAI